MDENDSDVDVGDEDDILADGEGLPEDEVDEVEQQEYMNYIATCKCVKLPNSTCTYECDYIRSVMMVGSRCKGLRVD